jgi:hypothetical protein
VLPAISIPAAILLITIRRMELFGAKKAAAKMGAPPHDNRPADVKAKTAPKMPGTRGKPIVEKLVIPPAIDRATFKDRMLPSP